MPARLLFPDTVDRVPIRLFTGVESGSDTRIIYPGVGAQAPKSVDLATVYAAVRDDHQTDQPTLTDLEVAAAREAWPLKQFYQVALAGWRRRQLNRGEIEAGTLQKERQSLRCFDGWDQRQQPAAWPAGNIWRGLPVGYLAGHYFERWAEDRCKVLSVDTVESRWCALRTVVNWAMRLGVMDAIKLPNLTPIFERRRQDLSLDCGDYDDFTPTTYTAGQLEAVYHALAGELDLQAAWVLGASTGPRTGDLFSLRWGVNVRLQAEPPELFYRADKTGKVHWIPLAPCVVTHLQQLARTQGHLDPTSPGGLVFPRLTAGGSKDPEKSRAAHARTARLKAALASVGIDAQDKTSDFYKPVQVLRSTCNTRLNNHRAGKGLLVTHGKDADVSSRHYWDERDALIEAVMSLPQPAAFLKLTGS